jgi:hypothetical protein
MYVCMYVCTPFGKSHVNNVLITRKSIALYYYTASVTDADGLMLKKTDFRARPGERLNVDG